MTTLYLVLDDIFVIETWILKLFMQSADDWFRFVKFITDAVKRSSDKYSEEKTMILRALAASLNFIGVLAVQSRVAPPPIEVHF